VLVTGAIKRRPTGSVNIVNRNRNRNKNYLISSTKIGMKSRNYSENGVE